MPEVVIPYRHPFVAAVQEMARSLEASQPVNQTVGGRVSFSGPAPPVKIR